MKGRIDRNREARARRLAAAEGLRLRKYRGRDSDAPQYGQFQIFEIVTGRVLEPSDEWLSLEEVEAEIALRRKY